MGFTYNPKDASMVLPEGEYSATIHATENAIGKTSKRPMLVVTVRVYGEGNQTVDIPELQGND